MPTVIVYWSPGRTADQKKRVSQRIHDALVDAGGARSEDVLVIFQNIEAGDSARPGQNASDADNHTLAPRHENKEDHHGF